jgi:hypothetical protein
VKVWVYNQLRNEYYNGRNKMKLNKLFIAMLFAFSINAFAQQQGDYSKEPGYFDFGDIASLKSGEMITEVYLEEPLLKMVAKMGESQEEGLGNILGGLKLVKVNEFMIDEKNAQKLGEEFETLDKNLQSKKWNRIIKTRHKNTNVNVYVKSDAAGEFSGLVIAGIDGEGKVTLVNIVGHVDLEAIGKLSKHFNFPGMEGMNKKEKDKDKDAK